MTDREETRSLRDVMADDALDYVNGPDNPFPPKDAKKQIEHNLVRGQEKPQTKTSSEEPTDVVDEAEAYLKNPHRVGLSNRIAAETVLGRRINKKKFRARDPLLPENIQKGLERIEQYANKGK